MDRILGSPIRAHWNERTKFLVHYLYFPVIDTFPEQIHHYQFLCANTILSYPSFSIFGHQQIAGHRSHVAQEKKKKKKSKRVVICRQPKINNFTRHTAYARHSHSLSFSISLPLDIYKYPGQKSSSTEQNIQIGTYLNETKKKQQLNAINGTNISSFVWFNYAIRQSVREAVAIAVHTLHNLTCPAHIVLLNWWVWWVCVFLFCNRARSNPIKRLYTGGGCCLRKWRQIGLWESIECYTEAKYMCTGMIAMRRK